MKEYIAKLSLELLKREDIKHEFNKILQPLFEFMKPYIYIIIFLVLLIFILILTILCILLLLFRKNRVSL